MRLRISLSTVSTNPTTKDHLFQAINIIMDNSKHYLLGINHAIRVDNIAALFGYIGLAI